MPTRREKWFSASTLLLPLGLVLAGCAAQAPPPPVQVERQEWTAPDGRTGRQLLTEHYDIRTTSRDRMLLEYIAPFMETAFDEYARLVPGEIDTSNRLVMYVFGSRNEWVNFTRRNFPAQAYTYMHIHAGGFMDRKTATCVIHDIGRDRTLALLGHEGFHQYVARVLTDTIPPWVNEGLATQWESFDLAGDRPTFTPERNFGRRGHLRDALGPEGGFIPLTDLLRMHAGEAVLETGRTVRTYYAQVWSMLLFIREGAEGRYADGLKQMLADAAEGRLELAVSGYRAARPEADDSSPGEIIFRHYITEDLDRFMSEYEAFSLALVH